MKNIRRGEGTSSHTKKTNTNKKQFNRDFIKREINPLDFYEHELSGVSLNKPEWNEAGICPFHDDNKSGSFHINLETGSYKCFSCGASGGDIIAFTMDLYGLSFPEALAKLADDWGLL